MYYDGVDGLKSGDWVLVEANLVLEKLTEAVGRELTRDAVRYVFGEEAE